jgi:hypothetical protein
MIKQEFQKIFEFLSLTFPYWNKIHYDYSRDYSIEVTSEDFVIRVKWYKGFGSGTGWSSKGDYKTLLLEFGVIDSKMIRIDTGHRGMKFENANEMISYIKNRLKENPEWYKLYTIKVRENKLERILNEDKI